MVLLDPAVPQGTTSYQAPTDSREALAGAIEPEVAQFFLASARCGCFMQAARSLNVKATQLRKRLAQLEEQLRHPLFSYQGSALTLSREGQQLQAQLVALAHDGCLPVPEQPLIRLAVAESILHDILGRDLIALLRRNASVRLQIISIDNEWALQALDADVVVWLSGMDSAGPGQSVDIGEPQALARLDYSPHIAKRYSRLAVRPNCIEDLADYMLVQWQPDRQVQALQPWNRLLEQRVAGVVQVQAYPLMLEMIRCSACIGLLPRYMSCFDRGLTALDGVFAEGMQRQVWLGVGRQVRHPQEVEWVVEMIRRAFWERREWFD